MEGFEGFLDFLFVVAFMTFVIRLLRRRTQNAAKTAAARPVPSVPQTDMEGPGYVAQGLPRENARDLPGYTPAQTVPAAPAQDRTDRKYQGISRPQPVQASPYASADGGEGLPGAPAAAGARRSPAVRRAAQKAAEPEPRPEGESVLDPEAGDEFCAVPETHGHEGKPLDDMQSRLKGMTAPSREELRRAVIWAEILGGRGGRQRTCRP